MAYGDGIVHLVVADDEQDWDDEWAMFRCGKMVTFDDNAFPVPATDFVGLRGASRVTCAGCLRGMREDARKAREPVTAGRG